MTLKIGSKGGEVVKWQRFLITQKYKISADGDFGERTDRATRQYQHENGLKIDGLVGKRTRSKAYKPLSDKVKKLHVSSVKTWDKKTDEVISQLHPDIQAKATRFINRCNQELNKTVRVYSGYRDFVEQDSLYAKGRTKPGKKVTNAPAGRSYHNYRLAFDCVEILHGKAKWSTDWESISVIGKEEGFEWGGDWKTFLDKPHFQMTSGFTTKQLLAKFGSEARKGNIIDFT